MIKRLLASLLMMLLTSVTVLAKDTGSTPVVSTAHYMANEGLMVVNGDTKVVFDPLFRNSYGQYQLLPKSMEDALFAGEPPFDGIDAVFVSWRSFFPGRYVAIAQASARDTSLRAITGGEGHALSGRRPGWGSV
jgi:hypothetical protein